MPSATDELREFAKANFGDLDVFGPQAALEERGFKLLDNYRWFRHTSPNDYEEKCIDFLMQEWDYGWWTDVEVSN